MPRTKKATTPPELPLAGETVIAVLSATEPMAEQSAAPAAPSQPSTARSTNKPRTPAKPRQRKSSASGGATTASPEPLAAPDSGKADPMSETLRRQAREASEMLEAVLQQGRTAREQLREVV